MNPIRFKVVKSDIVEVEKKTKDGTPFTVYSLPLGARGLQVRITEETFEQLPDQFDGELKVRKYSVEKKGEFEELVVVPVAKSITY